MYNGIGLETARGSGTNGYVQRNLSFIKNHKDRVDYKSEEELRKIDSQVMKGPNPEILDHDRKRKVELKCLEMEELMEEQGYGSEEITKKVSAFRLMLMEKDRSSDSAIELDETGRPIAKATHQIAEANQARNDQLKAAFGISDFFKEGSSFDPERKAKEEAAKNLAIAQKKYSIMKEKSSSESESDSDGEKEKKRKKRSRHNSSDHEKKRSKKEHSTRTHSKSKKKDKKKHRSSK